MLTKSETFKQEYCCTIVRIGKVEPIENSDFLAQVLVEGRTIVVRKDQVHEGDVMLYVANECQVNADFLHRGNYFEDRSMNANQEKKGYINKYGRIRMVKLRGILSMGVLFATQEIEEWCPAMRGYPFEEHVGDDFDSIDGVLFVKAYVPMYKEHSSTRSGSYLRKLQPQFDRIIPGEFTFHYETQQFNREIDRFRPEDEVSISVKLHGTSIVIGNVLTLQPRWGGLYARIFNRLPSFLQRTRHGYDVVYSSRSVIKNKYYDSKVGKGYYEEDVWGEYYNLLKPYIPEGYTIYGEIVGYVGGLAQMIQKGYDYGCAEGYNRLMIYRVSVVDKENGKHRELNIPEVQEFITSLRSQMAARGRSRVEVGSIGYEGSNRLMDIPILYQGCLGDLYPEIADVPDWNARLLERLKSDGDRLGMELNEPLCNCKVPREGICIRIMNDPINECFKLKTLRFLGKEAELIDKGEVDIELLQE